MHYILGLFLFCQTILGQQDPQYTHYMYNMGVINPAYATAKTAMLDLGLLYRSQWVGAVGAPKTLTAFGHLPVGKKIELGLSFISDDIGDGAKKENNAYADIAYVLQLNGNQRLSFGAKVGFTNLSTNFNGFRFENENISSDKAFEQNLNLFKGNLGFGAYYFTDHYYVGLSAPNILPSTHLEEKNGIKALGSENIHLFATAGYVFEVNEDWKLKPAMMAKMIKGTPISLDLSANVLYDNKFEFGLAYRLKDAVNGLVGMKVAKGLKIGYSYDYTLSNLGQFNSGTHEVFLLFGLDLLGKGYDKSPRFF
ncbi:PorP/SprF family type IX secretion system membrane protein [Flavobacterium sp.]|uniref:PorP/SprF family type IX secretion system membrane protein n=1 Tax=Flavobacterium sp. TaxID=239 RepID=UPI003D0C0ECC